MSGAMERGRSGSGAGPGRALRCEEARVLLMAYLDGELGPERLPQLQDHLAVCIACRREEQSFRWLQEVTDTMAEEQGVAPVDAAEAWDSIYRRLERGLGWVLLSAGVLLLAAVGAWRLLSDFLLDPREPLLLRVGVGSAVAGALVLLVSVGRETWLAYRRERYREVQR